MTQLAHENRTNPHKKEKHGRTYQKKEQGDGVWISLNDQFNTRIFVEEGRDIEKAVSRVKSVIDNPIQFA